ncbi:MAG: histidinol-phosphate aminotransferase family protein [Alphaproteobacteria bacterium]|nr:histidinol-phosphate aminotransferase family protein [Alphaproteobacteria bacterium]HPF45939.1 histidinol-phosphate transaminase [Emcibacteraceae bacterium]HRW28396.1 histidinol-phosphate transaminase [Emcibacteraceae bacterium]
MTKLTRRDWLKGTTAVAGGLVLAKAAQAQSVTMEGYVPTPENPIRMSSNENPYGVNRAARNAMNKSYDVAHKYGNSGQRELMELIAGRENISTQNMMITAGSSEILHTLALITGLEGGSILAPNPTFDNNFMKYADRMGINKIRVPVDENMAIDLDAMRKAMTDDVRIIYIVNPNNPTPTILHADELSDFCKEMSKKCYVFVDEAYYEYVDDPNYKTMIPLAVETDNMIVTRTASKIHGFAGVRIGFGFGTTAMLQKIKDKLTGSVSTVSVHGALASYKDTDYQDFVIRKNKESLAILYKLFDKHNLRYIKSNTNFTYFETGMEAKEFGDRMRKYGIQVGRPFEPFTKWCRISTAKPEDMEYFVEVYEKEFT